MMYLKLVAGYWTLFVARTDGTSSHLADKAKQKTLRDMSPESREVRV